jgi:hypothetical protein
MIYDVLDHGPARAGAKTFTVDHPDAAESADDAIREKFPQRVLGGVTAEVVQVDFGFDLDLAAAQSPEKALACAGTPERHLIAGIERRRIRARHGVLDQRVLRCSARESGNSTGARK